MQADKPKQGDQGEKSLQGGKPMQSDKPLQGGKPMQTVSPLKLGVLICRHCNEIIDELDTERVQIIYGVCDRQSCKRSAEVPIGKRSWGGSSFR